MKKNHLTVIIQPDVSLSAKRINPILSFSFHKRVIYYLFFSFFLFICFGISGTWSIIQNLEINNKITLLNAELDQLDWIESNVEGIRKDEKIIRESLGLEAWENNFDINERLGKGGSESQTDLIIPDINVEQEMLEIDDNRPLHERVHDLKEGVHELYLILSKMRITLNCRPTIMPVKDNAIWITSGFGWRKGPFTGLREFHKGLDISGRKGAPIIVTADGVVEKTGYNRFKGRYVRVKHDERFSTVYGHLMRYVVKKKQKVKRGEIIGYMGTSGMSTGYHLHYVVIDNKKKVNPYNFILNRNEQTLASSR